MGFIKQLTNLEGIWIDKVHEGSVLGKICPDSVIERGACMLKINDVTVNSAKDIAQARNLDKASRILLCLSKNSDLTGLKSLSTEIRLRGGGIYLGKTPQDFSLCFDPLSQLGFCCIT